MNPLRLKSVFLVDDDEISNFLNRLLLKNLGLEVDVHTAVNGREALHYLEEKNIGQKGEDGFTPCLLILDINMPSMNGWQFLEAFDKRYSEEIKKKIIIIMITVSEDERDIIRASNNYLVKDFIQKPLSDDTLIEILEKYFSDN
jgi:CheY-like chemotaxis protein